MSDKPKDPGAIALGRKGGLARSAAKTKAARKNARKRWVAVRRAKRLNRKRRPRKEPATPPQAKLGSEGAST